MDPLKPKPSYRYMPAALQRHYKARKFEPVPVGVVRRDSTLKDDAVGQTSDVAEPSFLEPAEYT